MSATCPYCKGDFAAVGRHGLICASATPEARAHYLRWRSWPKEQAREERMVDLRRRAENAEAELRQASREIERLRSLYDAAEGAAEEQNARAQTAEAERDAVRASLEEMGLLVEEAIRRAEAAQAEATALRSGVSP